MTSSPPGRQVFAWLHERGIPAAGPLFWKHNVIDMGRAPEIEVGVPVATRVDGDDGCWPACSRRAGTRPCGTPVTPDGMIDVIASLREWASREGLAWEMTNAPDGERWAARLEIHETDPAEEPDMARWTTQLAFRLSG